MKARGGRAHVSMFDDAVEAVATVTPDLALRLKNMPMGRLGGLRMRAEPKSLYS